MLTFFALLAAYLVVGFLYTYGLRHYYKTKELHHKYNDVDEMFALCVVCWPIPIYMAAFFWCFDMCGKGLKRPYQRITLRLDRMFDRMFKVNAPKP